jgi:hypothetical protein
VEEEAVMTKYTGGSKVAAGYYWNPGRWSVEVVPPEGGHLPGAASANYVKVPFPLLLLIVPVLGALFLIFLPLIGFGLFGYAIVRRVSGGVKESAKELASTVSPGWTPGEAHPTGKPGEEKAGEKATPGIEKLEKEIEARKNERK